MSLSPGGGAYAPVRCMISARLTPIAATLTRSWCGPGSGRSTETWTMDSGPPNGGVRIACIVGMGVSV